MSASNLTLPAPSARAETSWPATPCCPRSRPGENLCVFDAGAYGMSLASNYNTRPRAAEVLVDGTRARLIRRRETIKDLLQQEAACL